MLYHRFTFCGMCSIFTGSPPCSGSAWDCGEPNEPGVGIGGGIRCCDGAVTEPKVGTLAKAGFGFPAPHYAHVARWQDSRGAECGQSARSVLQGSRGPRDAR